MAQVSRGAIGMRVRAALCYASGPELADDDEDAE